MDLHLHSSFSSRSAGFFSDKLSIQESYISPQQIYNTLFERGMDLFTLTDHDEIAGCLEIAHLPGVFISEEITAYFPEDRCKVHVLAYGITEAQHGEIGRLRYNLYELVDYLQQESLCHVLAHPLYDMDGKLSRDHVERLLLLFDNWELINGTRSRLSSELTREIATTYEGKALLKLADKHGFNKRQRKRIGFSAGSDDHGGMDVGLTYTTFNGESFADLKAALQSGQAHPAGDFGSPIRLGHMLMNISYSWSKAQSGNKGVIAPLEYLLNNQRPGLLKRLMGAGRLTEEIHKIARMPLTKGAAAHDPHELLHSFCKNFFPHVLGQFQGVKEADIDTLSQLSGKALFSAIPTLFYLSTYYQRSLEKQRSRQIHRTMIKAECYHTGKVAYFTDTLSEINGVALTGRKLLRIAREENLNLTFITAYARPPFEPEDPFTRNFTPLMSFELPEYPEIRINIPHFLDMLEYCDQENFDVIYASTPGVVGIYAFLIAKILHRPFVTTFHTDFPGYLRRYSGDHLFEKHAWSAFSMMFNSANRVLSPSKEYRRILKAHGVKKQKITLFSRGIDHSRFNPEFRDESFWPRMDSRAEGKKVVLFVGRVAKEKNVDLFLQVQERLAKRTDLIFAIVGDGPLLESIRQSHGDRVILTGFLEGEALSQAFASADIFLFPSSSETFGNVVLEAQGAGLPVIVSAIGAVKENIIEGETGWAIAKNCPQPYADRIEQLLGSEKRLKRFKQAALDFTRPKEERAMLLEMLKLLSLDQLGKRL